MAAVVQTDDGLCDASDASLLLDFKFHEANFIKNERLHASYREIA